MHITWVPTDRYYREIIAAPDAETRLALYRERLVEPWRPMMQALAGQMGADPADELAGARAWGWPMPDELTAPPAALAALEAAGAWQTGEAALRAAVERFAGRPLPFDHVEGWLVVAAPERSNPIMRGYTGAVDWFAPRLICQYDTLSPQGLRSLPGAVAHEFHHLIRLRAFPWGPQTTVADYILHEGLAESFATALFGDEVLGYYASEIGDADLAKARELIGGALERTGFNVIRGYIFGDTIMGPMGGEAVGMPDYGGYAVGYRVAQAFLRRTGASIEEATFLPAAQIVSESGYFA